MPSNKKARAKANKAKKILYNYVSMPADQIERNEKDFELCIKEEEELHWVRKDEWLSVWRPPGIDPRDDLDAAVVWIASKLDKSLPLPIKSKSLKQHLPYTGAFCIYLLAYSLSSLVGSFSKTKHILSPTDMSIFFLFCFLCANPCQPKMSMTARYRLPSSRVASQCIMT